MSMKITLYIYHGIKNVIRKKMIFTFIYGQWWANLNFGFQVWYNLNLASLVVGSKARISKMSCIEVMSATYAE